MALFRLPWNYIPDPTRGKPLFYGKIYFGVADQDPLLFPKDVNLIQENGSIVVATQPILTSAGGVPVYDGSPVAIDLTGDYSIAIHDKDDVQVYYFANLTEVTNIIETSLRGAALRLNLDATLIGTVLVTNQSGQLLDNALYLQDTVTGLIYSLPNTIPAGSTVTSSSGTNLVTNNGSFTMHHVWVSVENRFKGNQNWNVAGSTGDPLPSSTPTLYTVGAEIAAGIEVITTNADQITYVNGVLSSGNNTGIIRRRYTKDAAGFITKNSQYGGVQLPDGTQLQAVVDDIATNGVRITEDSGDVCVDVDLSHAAIVAAGGFKFHGLSSESGVWPDINDKESIIYLGEPIPLIPDGTYGDGVVLDWSSTGSVASDFKFLLLQGFTDNAATGFGGRGTVLIPVKDFLVATRIQVAESTRDSSGAGLSYVGAISPTETTLTTKVVASGSTYTAAFKSVQGIM